jgi:Type I phosphodiesterase / nucleotide pyrophosphatase
MAAAVAGMTSTRLSGASRTPSGLLILLIAEQFRPDYLERTENRLGPGGFRRLMSEGSYFPDCRFVSSTFTATGLATLMTGTWPEVHGVVADSWYDRTTRKPVLADASSLEATTLAEPVGGSGRVFTVALDQQYASLLAGSSASQTFWMDPQGQFAGPPSASDWLGEFNEMHLLESLHDERWMALGAGPGMPPLRVLHFDPEHPEDFLLLFRSSPFSQTLQFELVRELIQRERLGVSDSFDLLAVSLGSLARLGYEVGADSPLVDQMALQLDRQIELTLDLLNKNVGAANYTLVFTAAHGAPPEPDETNRSEMAVAGETVARAINAGLSAQYDLSGEQKRYVEKYLYPFLYLRYDELLRHHIEPRQARELAGRLALRAPGVAGYYTADGDSSQHGDWLRRFRNSFHALRSGDLMLSYFPEFVEDFGAGRGVSYGSLYNYDASVPLLLYGPRFRAATFEQTVEAVDVAPTLARCCHLTLPSSTTGRVLVEALAEEPPRGK